MRISSKITNNYIAVIPNAKERANSRSFFFISVKTMTATIIREFKVFREFKVLVAHDSKPLNALSSLNSLNFLYSIGAFWGHLQLFYKKIKKNVSKILHIKNKVASLQRQTMTNILGRFI